MIRAVFCVASLIAGVQCGDLVLEGDRSLVSWTYDNGTLATTLNSSDVVFLKAKVLELGGTVVSQASAITTLQASVSSFSGTSSSQTSSITSLQSTVSTLSASSSSNAAAITMLQSNVTNLAGQISKISGGQMVLRSDENGAQVKAYLYSGGTQQLSWTVTHNLCTGLGKSTPGSSWPHNWNMYCSYSQSDNYVVTSGCNWAGLGFTVVSGSLPTKGYMCSHLSCDHFKVVSGTSVTYLTGQYATIYNNDYIFCSP